MLVHSCGCKYQLDTQLFSNLSQYSQSTVVEICKQDLYTLKGAYPLLLPLPTKYVNVQYSCNVSKEKLQVLNSMWNDLE